MLLSNFLEVFGKLYLKCSKTASMIFIFGPLNYKSKGGKISILKPIMQIAQSYNALIHIIVICPFLFVCWDHLNYVIRSDDQLPNLTPPTSSHIGYFIPSASAFDKSSLTYRGWYLPYMWLLQYTFGKSVQQDINSMKLLFLVTILT